MEVQNKQNAGGYLVRQLIYLYNVDLLTYVNLIVTPCLLFAENYFLTDPELKDTVPLEYLSHKEKYERGIKLSCLFFQKIRNWLDENESTSAIEVYQ